MNEPSHSRLLHRFAMATACLALLPIVVGAVVTSMKWGMAFLDWPTSDGHNMFSYPWLSSFAEADKFTEHGHRLAGALIGIFSIALAGLAWAKERRMWVKLLATGILLAVIVQGLLGGARVIQNEQALAMFHGSFAALVFTMMAAMALFTSRRWSDIAAEARTADVRRLKPLALIVPPVIAGQYLLGGLVRHIGTAVYEHIGLAVIVVVFVVVTAVSARRSDISWVRRPAYMMLLIVLVQASLGIGAYITKFGLQTWGYVAVQNSTPQVLFRTSHTVVGMLLFMTSVIFALRVLRVDALSRRVDESSPLEVAVGRPMQVKGGAQ